MAIIKTNFQNQKSVYEKKQSLLEQAGGFVKDILQGTARSGGILAKETIDTLRDIQGKEKIQEVSLPEETLGGKFQRVIFGEEPLGNIEQEAKRLSINLTDLGIDKNISNNISPLLIPFFVGLDFTGLGGGKEAIIKSLAKETSESVVKKSLTKLKVSNDFINEATDFITKTSDAKVIDNYLKELDIIQKSSNINSTIDEIAEYGGKKLSDSVGVKTPSGIIKTVDEPTKKELIEAIDYIRLDKPKKVYNQTVEENIGYLAEKYGIASKNYESVAKKFEELVDLTDTSLSKKYNAIEQIPEIFDSSTGKIINLSDEIKINKNTIKKAIDNYTSKIRQLEFKTPQLSRATAKEIEMGVSKAPTKTTIKTLDALKLKYSTLQKGITAGKKLATEEIKGLQTELIKTIKEGLPIKLRGKHLVDIKNANTIDKLNKALDNVKSSVFSYEESQRVLRDAAQKRKTIGYLVKLSEINQTAYNEVKREAGITKGLFKATKEQLLKAQKLLQERYRFGVEHGMIDFNKGKVRVSPEELAKAASIKKIGIIKKTKEVIGKSVKSISKDIDRFFGVVDTRIKNIVPDLNTKRTFFNQNKRIATGNKIIKPFAEKIIKFSKKQPERFNQFKLLWNNGELDSVLSIAKEKGFEKETIQLRKWLDGIYSSAKESGADIGKIEDYLPRLVKDKIGFQEYLNGNNIIEAAVRERESLIKRTLTGDEKSKYVSQLMRGYGVRDTINPTSKFIKERIIKEVTSEMNNFYYDPIETLIRYNDEMNNLIETNKFFKGKIVDLENGTIDWSQTIGNLVKDKNLNIEQAQELRDLLTARFSYIGSGGAVKNLKDMVYIGHLNSIYSALTQFGDIGWSLYDNGIVDTIRGMTRSLSKNAIKKADVGINKALGEEIEMGGELLGKMTNEIFKKSGIELVDSFGKETFLNASFKSFSQSAKTYLKGGKDNKSIKYLRSIFGDETDRVIKEFASGQETEDTFFTIMNRLSDFQPITLSDVPEVYLKHPAGRMFYVLKTFTLKQLDVYRREVFQEYAKGNIKNATTNLVRLASYMLAMNVGADVVKDIISGKEINLEDTAIDNILSTIGMNKYLFDRAKSEGPGAAIQDVITPPVLDPIDVIYSDFVNIGKGKISSLGELKSMRYIPFIGRFYYERTKSTTPTQKIKLPSSTGKKGGGRIIRTQ